MDGCPFVKIATNHHDRKERPENPRPRQRRARRVRNQADQEGEEANRKCHEGSSRPACGATTARSSSATIGDTRYQESFMLAHDLAHLDVSSSSKHNDCASTVGYPIEYFAMMHDRDEYDHYNDAYAPRCRKRSLSEHGLGAETRASSYASITSTCSTASNVSTGISIPVTVTAVVKASSSSLQSSSYHSSVQKQHNLALDLPPRLVEQHHVELNTLRCLSLNLMLSSSTPSGGSSGMMAMPQPSTSVPKVNSFEFEIGCQPQLITTQHDPERLTRQPSELLRCSVVALPSPSSIHII